jgi:hypothetical protein
MSDDFAARLARAGGSGTAKKDLPPAKRIREFDGQVVTVASVKTVSGGKFGDSVIATYIDDEGNETDVWQTGNSGKQLKEIADFLPRELKVESFDTDFGNRGYKYVAV